MGNKQTVRSTMTNHELSTAVMAIEAERDRLAQENVALRSQIVALKKAAASARAAHDAEMRALEEAAQAGAGE